jgi:Undecaprenyl-phosphate glucose phosphotransferase
MFFMKTSEEYSRGSFAFQIIGVSVVVLTARSFLFSWLRSLIAASRLRARSVILIGDPLHCSRFASRLKANGIQTSSSFRLPSRRDTSGKSIPNITTSNTGDIQKLVANCRSLRPDDIIAFMTGENMPDIIAFADSISELPVGFHIIPAGEFEVLETARIAEFGNLQTIQLRNPPLTSFDRFIKRTFDICAATAGLIFFCPLLLVVSIAIKLDSRGPILFRQTRHGFNNDLIRMFKFRTMGTVEEGDNFTQATHNDVRVTRVGRILRYTSIDELPQLLNVLLGDMSIVGPRPHPTALNEAFKEQISPFLRRHAVKPGMTGWAQVNGFRGPTDTLEKMRQRIECDIYYIDNWSFRFDMKIIIMTVFTRQSYLNAF